jgi:hypothetical protein
VIIVRYADDFVVGFQHRRDAERFLVALRERLCKFALSLHPDKTRLIEFGRFAVENRRKRGEPRPGSFNFLGFTHTCALWSKGDFRLLRHTIKKLRRAKLRQLLLVRRHLPLDEVGSWLQGGVRGYYNYHLVPGNSAAMQAFYREGQEEHEGIQSTGSSMLFFGFITLTFISSCLPVNGQRSGEPRLRFVVRLSVFQQ